jgi:4-hydroxy-3-methylbut-2-enyl diphosphate reductase
MVRVVRCRFSGFCKGVCRAIALARHARENGLNTFSDGKLVHNDSVIKFLESIGIFVWDGTPRTWSDKDCLIIRAHGISPQRRAFLEQLGCNICDGTCPHVARVGEKIRQLRRNGYEILLFGDACHPEVQGLAAQGGEQLHVIASIDELKFIPVETGHIAIISQTTANVDDFSAFANAARRQFSAGEIFSTICETTLRRQEEVDKHLQNENFAAAVVVGSQHSSNSQKLAEKLRKNITPTFFVANVEELKQHATPIHGAILLAVGSSTPPWEMDAVEAHLALD